MISSVNLIHYEQMGRITMAYQTVNPYDNQIVATFDDLTDEQVMGLLAQAQETFESWGQTSFAERATVLGRAAAILRERPDEFAHLLTLEMGKLYNESLGEVELTAQIFDYYAEHAQAFLAPKRLDTASPNDDAMIVSAPLGVILGVQPWNFPYYQLVRVAAPNLMAGNVVIVKHASNVPQAAAAFERLLLEAGAPEGAYTNAYATKDQINMLIDDPRVRGVAVTGGEGARSVVAARAGKNLKKSTMELGGSDAMIVLADADLDKTVQWALWGRMNNGGQCCVASKRIIVVDEIADEFLEKFKAALSGLNAGDPFDEMTTLPPMSTQGAADGLNEQVKAAAEAGATVVACGEPVPAKGAFVQPTILTDLTPENPAYHQEFFGPVRFSSGWPMRTKPCDSLTIRATGLGDRCTPRTSTAGSRSPNGSRPAWCSSTTRPGPSRTCRSAASNCRATGTNCRTWAYRNSSTRSSSTSSRSTHPSDHSPDADNT
jgi:succinate-semialdehyde dehydrogenase/glutarate-semialdehyde dehydrogenase